MTSRSKIALTAMALMLAPLASAAHHREGHGGGRDQASSQVDLGNGSGGNRGSDAEGIEEATGTRPRDRGLAKGETTACVPPG